MKSRGISRIDGLGVVIFRSGCACRTVIEPLFGLILTLGLFWTLTVH